MQTDNVEYWVRGDKVRGWFYAPDSRDDRLPGVVFCPGYSGTRFAAFYQAYVERLTDAGFVVLLSDYRGWGDSDGIRGVIDPLQQVEDIRAGLTYLETRPEVDRDRLALFGVSFGGGHATYVAGIDRRVRAAVAVSAVSDGREWMRRMRREYEWIDFLQQLSEERRSVVLGNPPTLVHPNEGIQVSTPERRTTKVKGQVDPSKIPDRSPLWCADAIIDYSPAVMAPNARGVLWICLEQDAVVPPEHSHTLYRLAQEPKRLVVLNGSSHYAAYVEHLDNIWRETRDWLTSRLSPVSSEVCA